MISQSDWKALRALHQKKQREEQKRFLAQGRKVVVELLGSSLEVEAIFATEEAAAWLREQVDTRAVPVHVLAAHQLDKLGTLEKGNELVAVVGQPAAPAFRAPVAGELMLALEDVHDPRNMGSLLRIADWFGVTRVMCSPDSMEVFNPKVVMSSMGSLFRVEVRYASLVEDLRACAAAGARVFLASMEGKPVFECKLSRPAVLVLGSESHGLSDALRAAVTAIDAEIISIPRVGRAESLNVAMAGAALCSEFARQTG